MQGIVGGMILVANRGFLPTRQPHQDPTSTLVPAIICSQAHNVLINYGFCDWSLLIFVTTGHALRRQTAGQFGPDLAKKLSQLVKMEKNVMRSMEQVGRERMEVAVSIELPLGASLLSTNLSSSNNSPSGVKLVTMMFRMSRTSLVS